jgi:hypothetical protein
MRHVSPPLAQLTAHAQALTSSGDLAGARAVLADALAPTDTDPHRATPDVAAAAALHARVLVTLGDPQAARDWAGFAHTAQRRLYGPDDERTLAATATHAAVLHRLGNHALAAQLYRDVVEQLTATDGPDSMRVLAAQADLATAEHAAGECVDAHARMADAWQRHRRIYGDAAPAGIKMLARLGGMERDCGQVIEAREHLALAGEFCARYLPGDHVLARQVAALAKAPISGRHRCDADAVHGFPPDAARPTVHPAPGVTPTGPPGVTSLPRPQQRPDPVGAPRPAGAGAGEHRDEDDRRLPVPVHHAAPRASRRLVVGGVVAVGALAAAATAAFALPRDDRDPAAPGGVEPAPAAAVTSTATGATPAAPSSAAAAAPSSAATAAPPSSAAAAAAGTVAAAPVPAAGTATAGPAPTSAAAAPSAVVLRDARDSVTLEWTYPPGAEGPVLISGGRTGQQRRAFQQMPAGSTDYVVYGLNERADYCFTVAVVYSADVVAGAPPVCTARG